MRIDRLLWAGVAAVWLSPLLWGLHALPQSAAAAEALALDSTVLNTVLVAITGACVSLIASLGMAFAAFGLPVLRSLLRVALVPLLLAPRSLTLVPLQAMIVALDLHGSLVALTLCLAAGAIPLQALVLTEALHARGAPWKPLLELSGAGPVQQAVLLAPLVERICLALFLLELLRGANTFLLPLLFTAGTPDLQTLPVRAWQAAAGAPPDLQVAVGLIASAPGFLLLWAVLSARERAARHDGAAEGTPPAPVT